ncbi:hypothetical protein PSEUDO8AS_50139 [Pseudomonas sp. 8AS]|uniref:hypothetical protein n=1 Tax=Pseudomonas sp. 8AS TaxID=2653163 RepID=UPI0012F11860|nr:hypothetical protein [Pseudomonas sp. 8AS]VXC13262.1 hypothetical protein PSEUDO8AS_50139 [Pseudomonas sp. 8AS]
MRESTTTKRKDWLTEGLSAEDKVFVSGSDAFSKRIGATGQLTLRIFGHHPINETPPNDPAERRMWLPSHYKIPFVILTCEMERQDAVDSFNPSSVLKIRDYLSYILGLPTYLVAYSRDNLNLTGAFHTTSPNNFSELQSPSDFANQINRLRAGRLEDEPEERKAINKSFNDVFQIFTRSLVSWQFSINDVDVLVTAPSGVIFLELKRSSVIPWQPYLDDAANYLLMRSLTRLVPKGIDFTLRYDLDRPCEVEVHTILGISREVIPGFRKKISGPDEFSVIKEVLALLRDPEIQAYGSQKS